MAGAGARVARQIKEQRTLTQKIVRLWVAANSSSENFDRSRRSAAGKEEARITVPGNT